ncbi:MAG TPA: hypothetical protein VHP33_40230 [Polyangiaceae bacterium]|nr:hypothetical protein [Polyangiaceae bacterium]
MRSLEQLAASVEEFEARPEGPAQRELAKVLQSLGSAMEPLSHATNLRVREVAQRLAGSPPTSLSHAGLLKQALTRVLESLMTTTSPPRRREEYIGALRALRQTAHDLDDLLALANQRPRTVAALHAAADAVFLARGGEAPFGEAKRMEAPPAPLGSFEAELDRAHDEVSRLAQSNLVEARKAAAAALSALGNVVAAADEGNRLGKQIAEIRFEAERLERAHANQFGQSGWIRSGLESAVDALAALHGGNRSSPWLRIAQRAVANIEQRSWLSFERAQVQDAFRATVDAFAALAQCREVLVPPNAAPRD